MLIALVGRAYTGKTAIANELVTRGWTLLSFTDHLKQLAAYAINSVGPHQQTSVADILADKPRYRRFIQEFGSLIGYESDPGWVTAFLEDELIYLAAQTMATTEQELPNAVIDCLRSSAQIEGARKFGAKVVGVAVNDTNRAMFAGMSSGINNYAVSLVRAADDHPIDGALNVWEMETDCVIVNTPDRPVPQMVDDLLGSLNFLEALREDL